MIAALRGVLRRRAGDVPATALAAVAGSAALGYAASLGALLSVEPGGVARAVGLLVLIVAPLLVVPALPTARTAAGLRRTALLIVSGLQAVLAVELARLDDGTVLAAAFCAAQGHALVRSTHAGAAALSLALSLGQSSSALRVAPSEVGMLVLILQLTLALVALSAMHGVGARRLAARNRRVAASLPDPSLGSGPRLRYGLRLASALALPALSLLAVGARLGNGSWLARGPQPQRPRAPEAQDSRRDERSERGAEPGVWRDSLSLGEGVGRLSEEVVLWARPRSIGPERGTARVRALWLAVLLLDTFDEQGLSNPRLGLVRERHDGDDGERDGWIELAAPEGELFELEIVQRPLRVARSAGDALVRSRPLVALQAERVLHDPDGVLVLPTPRSDWFTYRELCVAPWSLSEPSSGARARHRDPRFTQLPPPSPELERLAAEARRLLSDARDDAERVRRLLRHFEREFDYSLQGSGFAGLPGVLAFLESREGYCTSFAAAAVLLLRTQGVACRAVGGYLAHEWDTERESWVVRGRHAHAWIEVYFEGLGWRSFDPTPARRREAAFARSLASGPPPVAEWGAELASAMRAVVLDDGPTGALQRIGRVLAQGPQVLGASIGRRPIAWVSALALGLVLLAALARRRVGRSLARLGVRLPGEPPPVGAYERLLALLAGHGLSPRVAETLREFSRRAVAQAGVPADLVRATEIFYRARFGGLPPSADERAFLEELAARIREGLAGDGARALPSDP